MVAPAEAVQVSPCTQHRRADSFRNAVVDGEIVDVSGNELPYAPRWSANVVSYQY